MKAKLKLGFTDTHEHLATFFYSVLQQRYDIELVTHGTPDFLIFGDRNFGENNRKFSRADCTKIFYTGENQRPEHYDCDYAISFDLTTNPRHYRLPLYVVYMWALDNIHRTGFNYNTLWNVPQQKEKTSFCSFVVSNPNCPERNEFFKLLNKEKPVDSGGRLYNNIKTNLDGETAKIDFLSTRKFNICFEAYSYPGYTTEKILHAFYARTIPIYWGNPNVGIDFNRDAFIDVSRYGSTEEVIKHILYLDEHENAYNDMVNQPPFMYNIPTPVTQLDNFLNWFDAIVYKKY